MLFVLLFFKFFFVICGITACCILGYFFRFSAQIYANFGIYFCNLNFQQIAHILCIFVIVKNERIRPRLLVVLFWSSLSNYKSELQKLRKNYWTRSGERNKQIEEPFEKSSQRSLWTTWKGQERNWTTEESKGRKTILRSNNSATGSRFYKKNLK